MATQPQTPTHQSALRDNRDKRGTVGDFLKEEIQCESSLSYAELIAIARKRVMWLIRELKLSES